MPGCVGVRRGIRRSTGHLRRLPEILIVGAMRSGSSSLFKAMIEHPAVVKPSRKEVHFFDLHFDRGEQWYRAFFPIRGTARTVEASASYLVHERAADRAHRTVPDARIIAVLRDPVARAWSHFRFRRAKGTEKRSFHEVIEQEIDGKASALCEFEHINEISIVGAGLYALQIREWIDRFGMEGVMAVTAEDLFRDDSTLAQLQEFAGLDPKKMRLPRLNTAPQQAPNPQAMGNLMEFYSPANEELYSLLGRDLEW